MKKIKYFLVFAVVLALIPMTSFAKSMEFAIDSNVAYISDNGISQISLDASPVIMNSRTLVPIRVIAENFGSEVVWDNSTRTVKISQDNLEVLLKIDDSTAYINGKNVTLDAAPQIINSRTMLPIRFVCESLGMNIEYIWTTRQVYITDESPAMVCNGNNVYLDDFRFLKNALEFDFSDKDAENEFYDLAFDNFKKAYIFGSLAEYNTDYSAENREDITSYVLDAVHDEDNYAKVLVAPGARFITNTSAASIYLMNLYNDINVELSDDDMVNLYYLATKSHVKDSGGIKTKESWSKETRHYLGRVVA